MRTHEVLVHVRRGDEFLVLRRCERLGGYWHPVAGGVEDGEDARAAAIRELGEEVGLVPGELEPLRSFSYAREAWEPQSGAAIEVDCFLTVAPPDWEPRLNWEHVEARWCGGDEACELLRWPEPRELVRELAS